MQTELGEFLRTVLESPTVIADHSWRDGIRPVVLEVSDRDARLWYAKRHLHAENYHAELTAYRRWTPALKSRAPQLYACKDQLLALVITALPGSTPQHWQDPDLQHQAGKLLRVFHDAESFPPYDDIVVRNLERLEHAAVRIPGLIEPRAVDFARAHLRGVERMSAPRRVPCHHDYSPRNWLVDNGELCVIDFGDSGLDAWIADFGRLFIGWRLEPEPKTALLDGYGRTPSADDLGLLRAIYTVTLISTIVFAHEEGYTQAEAAFRELLQSLMAGEIA